MASTKSLSLTKLSDGSWSIGGKILEGQKVNLNGDGGVSAPESVITVESPKNGVQTTAFTIDVQHDNGSSVALNAAPTNTDVKTGMGDASVKSGVSSYSTKETRRKRETLEAKREKKAAKTLVNKLFINQI